MQQRVLQYFFALVLAAALTSCIPDPSPFSPPGSDADLSDSETTEPPLTDIEWNDSDDGECTTSHSNTFDEESDLSGWEADWDRVAFACKWHHHTAGSNVGSLHYGKQNGEKENGDTYDCVTNKPASNDLGTRGTIVSPSFNVPSTEYAYLTFRVLLQIETTHDKDRFEVLVGKSSEFEALLDKSTDDLDSLPRLADKIDMAGASWNLGTWHAVRLNLSDYSGQSVRVAFRFATMDTHDNNSPGVFIDDLAIEGCDACKGICLKTNQCGDNGCGDSCGSCPNEEECDPATSQCVGPCTPSCQNKGCGEDGCGGVCGVCGSDEDKCIQGQCVQCGSNQDCEKDSAQYCSSSGQCVECLADGDCNDEIVCTQDACIGNGCTHDLIDGCCVDKSNCDDDDDCTQDACTGNGCTHDPIADCCLLNEECADQDDCTQDACNDNVCTNETIAGCCLTNTDCDDQNACTTDTCTAGGFCFYAPISCADDGDDNPCTYAVCDPATLTGCEYKNRLLNTSCYKADADAGCKNKGKCQMPSGSTTMGCSTAVASVKCPVSQKFGNNSANPEACDSVPTHGQCNGVGQCLLTSFDQNIKLPEHPCGKACTSDGNCNDGNGCTVDKCEGNLCEITPDDSKCIPDSDPCTVEVCDPLHGCLSVPAEDGTPCASTVSVGENNSTCAGGECIVYPSNTLPNCASPHLALYSESISHVFCADTATRLQAFETCAYVNRKLVRIENLAHNTWIVSQAEAMETSEPFWIGLTFNGTDWAWEDGEILTALTQFTPLLGGQSLEEAKDRKIMTIITQSVPSLMVNAGVWHAPDPATTPKVGFVCGPVNTP